MSLVSKTLKFDTEFGEVLLEVQNDGTVLKMGKYLGNLTTARTTYQCLLVINLTRAAGRQA